MIDLSLDELAPSMIIFALESLLYNACSMTMRLCSELSVELNILTFVVKCLKSLIWYHMEECKSEI